MFTRVKSIITQDDTPSTLVLLLVLCQGREFPDYSSSVQNILARLLHRFLPPVPNGILASTPYSFPSWFGPVEHCTLFLPKNVHFGLDLNLLPSSSGRLDPPHSPHGRRPGWNSLTFRTYPLVSTVLRFTCTVSPSTIRLPLRFLQPTYIQSLAPKIR